MRTILATAMLALAITTAGADDGVFWYRQGANNIEFERTKTACQSRQLEAAIAPPLAWFAIFELCMRAKRLGANSKNSLCPADFKASRYALAAECCCGCVADRHWRSMHSFAVNWWPAPQDRGGA